jgi:beta-galactosidase
MLYINKSATKPVWAMEYSRDEAARKFQDDFTPPFHIDSPDYNRNQDSHAAEDVRRWFDYWRERPGGGDRVSSGGVNIIFSDSNTHFRGDNNYRRSGEVDAMRLPKEGFHAHQVMWDGWVDVERPRSHIIGHWNYAPGVTKDVLVVSSADSVELLLNGKSLGRGVKSDGFLFTFKAVAWAPGTLRAVGRDAAGKVVSSDERVTTGPAVALRLTPHVGPSGWRADGADLALVDVEAVDAQGRRVPTALDLVKFDVAGPAEWRGGIAQGDSKGGAKPTEAPASPTGDVVTGAHTVDGVTSYAGASRGDDNYILSRDPAGRGGDQPRGPAVHPDGGQGHRDRAGRGAEAGDRDAGCRAAARGRDAAPRQPGAGADALDPVVQDPSRGLEPHRHRRRLQPGRSAWPATTTRRPTGPATASWPTPGSSTSSTSPRWSTRWC